MRHKKAACILSLVVLGLTLSQAEAQNAPAGGAQAGVLTGAQDHQRLMDLLKMSTIRPGRNGTNPQAADFANYDETKATPFPDLPDPLTMKDGTKVTRADQWPARRAEIVEDFDREIYGRVPKETPKVTWEVSAATNSGTTITRTLAGHVDNSAYPAITVNIQASVTIPANATGPVPVIFVFGGGGGAGPGAGFGGAAGRAGPGAGRGAPGGAGPGRGAPGGAPGNPGGRGPGAPGGAAPTGGPGALGPNDIDMEQLFFVAAPAGPGAAPGGAAGGAGRGFGGGAAGGRGGFGGGPGGPGAGAGGPSWQQQALAKGWGYGTINTGSIQADNGNGLQQGIIGLCNKGQPRKLDDWGVLRAWGWGASRVLDCLEEHKEIGADPKQIGLEGHSRWGKGTVVAMAYDPRFAIAYVSSSGEGGAHINRRNFGEIIENISGNGEYHWMAGNFLKYAGPLTGKDLPVDGHELVAMCAPRPVFISGGNFNPDGTFTGTISKVEPTQFTLSRDGAPPIVYALHATYRGITSGGNTITTADLKPGMTVSINSNGNDAWQDPFGMYLAAKLAGPVYTLLGKKDLGSADDAGKHISSQEFPPYETTLIDGDVAFRQHSGGHTDAPNWATFLTFADRYVKAPKPAAPQ